MDLLGQCSLRGGRPWSQISDTGQSPYTTRTAGKLPRFPIDSHPPQSALTLPHHDDHALLGLCCSPIASHTNLRMGYRRGTHERICVRHAYGREGRGGSLPQCEHTHAASHGVRYGVRSCVVMGHEDETLRDRSEGYTGHLRCVAETHIASEQPNQHYVRECVSERRSL